MHKSEGYTHFHWEGEPNTKDDLVVGERYNRYLLKLTAIDSFYFDHGDGFPITPGIDYISHYNIEIDEDGNICGTGE